ncbi:Uncharacterised protein [Vibrio cholerae]|nr:Uncharacterised protein [Vibrio cholerae]CSC86817.1 Uncharacterised protein [Vibrio cholerae]CSI59947.1 Uncharacterised protein [Vibrio cholerae]
MVIAQHTHISIAINQFLIYGQRRARYRANIRQFDRIILCDGRKTWRCNA